MSIFKLTENTPQCAQGSSGSWDLKVRKLFIFPDRIQKIDELNNWFREYDPSPHIVPFKHVKITPLFFLAVADDNAIALLGSPQDYSRIKRGLNEEQTRVVIRELLHALLHIHNRGVPHSHLSLDALRQHSTTGRIVILEHILPINAIIPNTAYSRRVLQVSPPEILRYEPYSYAADIWSVGVIVHELLFPDKEFTTVELEDTDLLSPYLSGLSGLTSGFVMLCLKSDPCQRATLGELLTHPFTAEVLLKTDILEDDSSGTDTFSEIVSEERSSSGGSSEGSRD